MQMDTSKKIFVTGSTGFVGSALIAKLLERGFTVRALRRSVPTETQPNLESISGDITDKESLQHGMTGCHYVFHLAAYAKNWARDPQTYTRVNIEGTKNVFAVAQKLNIERIVWTSTIVTLGPTPARVIGNEHMPRQTEQCFTEYERTKTVMEREAAEWVKNGLPLVIVNPTRVFGPGVQSESNSVTRLIDQYRRGRFPILLNRGRNIGNYGFINDVVEGHILAMERGKIGERYILGGENVTLEELFQTVDKIDNKKRFRLKIFWLIPMLLAHFLELQAKCLGIYPLITPGWVRTFLVDWAFSCEKAERELGYRTTSLAEAIRQTCRWLDEGDCKFPNR
ncbi:MAG: NAD-dependent epimerase/dehydratase family protein [Planctomycetaceae bacterium]|nr:NAD-dependent epimerase/dehydratase family protein [Planctomycetaceae bacterium]